MARNNLRIIYQNVVDASSTTFSASSTAGTTNVANLKKDTKSLVWRSNGKSSETITVTFTQSIIGGIILPFCNLSSTAILTVQIYTGASLLKTYSTTACPYSGLGLWDWGVLPLGSNSYSYGGGAYGRIWFTEGQISCNKLVITINDSNNASSYLELSRLVIGSYWSPLYNTEFGLSTSMKDLSEHTRTESGDLQTNRGIRYNTMNFDLKYLNAADRLSITQIMRGSGIPKPLFISLFPNDEDSNKEQSHQIYGKLSQLGDITHPIFSMYSTSVDIEEI